MAELKDRDKTEDEFLIVLLALFERYDEQTEDFEEELRVLLVYWLGLIFVRSAIQHGSDQEVAENQAMTWVVGHVLYIIIRMRSYSKKLESGGNEVLPATRAQRMAVTETTSAASSGSEFAAKNLGYHSGHDLWVTRPEASATGVCQFCAPLHLQPRNKWLQIYQNTILPAHPEFAAYGVPAQQPAHVACKCYTLYVNRDPNE